MDAHLDQARRLLAAGRAAEALAVFDAALRLWRGEPLAGLPGPFVEGQRLRLDELRLTVVEDRAEAMLRAGEHHALLAELRATAADNPYRERLCGLVMTALCQDGRRSEALEVFAATRRLLVDELGVEPGPELRELHRDILNDAGGAALGIPATPGRIIPRQLPAAVRHFCGRSAERAALDAILAATVAGQGTVVVSAIDGMAGRHAVVHRLTGWYLHTACAARTALSPSLPPMAPEPVRLRSAPLAFDGHAEALAWFETERSNLMAAARLAGRYQLYRVAWQIPTAMYGFFDLRTRYDDWVDSHEIALRCARSMGDREAQDRIQCNLGNAYRPLRRFTEAVDCYLDALEMFQQVGYVQGLADRTPPGTRACAWDDLPPSPDTGFGVDGW